LALLYILLPQIFLPSAFCLRPTFIKLQTSRVLLVYSHALLPSAFTGFDRSGDRV
jgi:hypothetical protein